MKKNLAHIGILSLAIVAFFGAAQFISAPEEANASRVLGIDIVYSGTSCPDGYEQEPVDNMYSEDTGEGGSDVLIGAGELYICISSVEPGPGGGGSGGGASANVSLSANPPTIDQGGSSTLSWSGESLVPGSCQGSGFSTGGTISGSSAVSPNSDTTFYITCNAIGGGEVSDSASVTVIPIVSPDPDDDGPGSGGGAACSDGIDNDGDGYIDHPADGGCSGSEGSSESEITLQCSDGIDNDGDGNIDHPADSDCSTSQDSTEGFEALALNADRTLVPRGQTIQLDWAAVGTLESCTLSGSNGDFWNLSGTSGAITTSAIEGTTTYTLACEDEESNPVSTSLTVKIVPVFQEI